MPIPISQASGLTVIFYKTAAQGSGMLVAEGGMAANLALMRMQVAIDSGEAAALTIKIAQEGVHVADAAHDAHTTLGLMRDAIAQDTNPFVRDSFAAVLGTL